jgi:hypothetical protein
MKTTSYGIPHACGGDPKKGRLNMTIRWGAVMRFLIFFFIVNLLMPGVPDWVCFVWGFIDPVFTLNSEPKNKGKHAA